MAASDARMLWHGPPPAHLHVPFVFCCRSFFAALYQLLVISVVNLDGSTARTASDQSCELQPGFAPCMQLQFFLLDCITLFTLLKQLVCCPCVCCQVVYDIK